MSMYSTVEGTSSLPEMNGLPNVSQYGWTAFEIENYTQLGDYVNKCKEYFDGITENVQYIKTMYEAVFAIKEQVDIIANTIRTQEITIKEYYDDINRWYHQIALWEESIKEMQRDITTKHGEVVLIATQVTLVGQEVQKLHDAVKISEANAKESEEGAKGWFNKSYDLYLDLQKQQVYRGLWNPNSGAYPDGEGTNSYWDVILNPNQEQHEFDGKIWYFGDRLVYVLSTGKFEQLEAGLSNVKSVNGKTGAVTLVAGDVNAYTKAETDASLALKADLTYTNAQLALKADKTITINSYPLSSNVVLGPTDVNAISSVPVTLPNTVSILTDRSVVSTNNILTLNSIFTDAPSGFGATVLNGQIRTTKSSHTDGASLVQELWLQDGTGYIRIGSATSATTFVWNGGDVHGWRVAFDSARPPSAKETGGMPVDLNDLADTNLDTLLLPHIGVYAQQLNAHATVANGYPVGAVAGVLEVVPGPYKSTGGVMQRYTNHIELGSWTRYLQGDGTKSEWMGLPSINIGTTHMLTLPTFDWQNQRFMAGAKYLTNCAGWVGGPAEASYPSGYSVTITVDMINDSANVIEVTTSSNTTENAHYNVYKVLIVGAPGARTFTVRKIQTSAQPVAIAHGGTGTNNPDAALAALGGVDMVTSGSDITLLSKANPARDKNIRIHANNNDIRTVGADGTVARFYNDKTYRPTAADFGGLYVDAGNEVNFPVEKGESTLYFNYKTIGSEINKISFNNGKSQINGYCDIDVKSITSTGDITTTTLVANRQLIVGTADGNQEHTPNGLTYIGLRDANGENASHYFRGKGTTFIDTFNGMYVTQGPVHSHRGVNTSQKPYGTYDFESLIGWSGESGAVTNHLRKFRAEQAATIFHEAVVGYHTDARANGALSWWSGIGPEVFLASINQFGEINARGLKTYGDSATIQLNCESNQSSYMKGVNGGKDLWVLGKTAADHRASFYYYHPDQPLTVGMDLYPDFIQHAVHGNATTRTYRDLFRVDGASWARHNSHSYADQWGLTAPIYVEYGAVPGGSDYYPIVRATQSAAGQGFTTQVDLGIIRNGSYGSWWGNGVIRVGSAESGSASYSAAYEFGIDGVAIFPGFRTTTHGIGLNTTNGLGPAGLSIGDNDTGLRWVNDGAVGIYSNGVQNGYWNQNELYYRRVLAPKGFFVPETIHGSDQAVVRGPVEGGGWDQWRERAPALLVDCPFADTSAHSVWKATQWSREHIACMDVHSPAGGAVVRMTVQGAVYQFHANGQAHGGQWVSTSDMRLKTKVSKVTKALDIVDDVETIRYALKSDESTMLLGYSAQNLQPLIPEVVSSKKVSTDSDEEVLGVNYGAMSSFNTACIKELKAVVEDQQKQIDELKKLVEALTSK